MSAANSEEVSSVSAAFQAASLPGWHCCADAALPGRFAAARPDGAWATLQLLVHRPSNYVIRSACQPVEIWCEFSWEIWGGKEKHKNLKGWKLNVPFLQRHSRAFIVKVMFHVVILLLPVLQPGFLSAAEEKGFELLELRGEDPRLASLDTLSGEEIPLHFLFRLNGYIIQVGRTTSL